MTQAHSNDPVCQICGKGANFDRHHVVPRGMGGSKDPAVLSEENLIWLCRGCHRNVHEGGWALERSDDGLRVVDGRTGAQVMRRRYDSSFDASTFLALMDRLEASLSEALELIPYFDDEQLVAAFRDSRSLGRRAWVLQAAILHEAQRRSTYGDRTLQAIARKFEISQRQAQKYALVWSLFFESNGDTQAYEEPLDAAAKSVNVDAFLLDEPSWYLVAASESPDPRRWLAYAQDKKAENPRYSVSEFRREIQRAVQADGSAIHATGRKGVTVAPLPTNWNCPWVKPYCTRSGLPVPAEQCRCEA